ncbi:phage tail tape measure protein [Pectobacterium actinidiae]|uniref:Phage tail tape measure protein n=1 Tax=Pectobacterium actinidiae TaxID=1507808 RepID=A0ABW8G8G4_9GAMM
MAQQVGDLVVNLDADSASFKEQIERAKKQLSGFGESADSASIKAREMLNVNAASRGLTTELSRNADAAKRAGISVGQYNAAMRMLPAQMTDVVTQLAGQQNPLLILIQQGGQIKDSFGGIIPTFQALAGAINPIYLGVTALAGTVGYLGYQVYQSSKQTDAFNQSIAKTGNISGQTSGSLKNISDQIAENVKQSKSSAAAVVAQATGLGLSIEQIKLVSQSALIMSKTTGQNVEDLVTQLGKIPQDPLKSFIDINNQYNFANLALYEQVKNMVDLGDKAGATKLIIESLTDSQKKFKDDGKGGIDSLSDAWDVLIGKIKSYKIWNDSVAEKATTTPIPPPQYSTGSPLFDRINSEMREQAKSTQKIADDLIEKEQHLASIRETQQARTSEFNKDQVEANVKADEFLKSARTHAQIRIDLEKTYNEQLSKGLINREKYNKLIAAVNEKYKDPKQRKFSTPSGDKAEEAAQAQLIALQAQLKVLTDHKSANDVISQQRKDLWQTEAQYAVLQESSKTRQLSTQEKSLLAHSKETLEYKRQLADLGDKIALQQKLNALADQATKFAQQQSAKRSEIDAASQGLSSREAGRESTRDRLRSVYEGNPEAQQKVLAEQEKTYAAEDALRANWQAGAKSAWAEYADSATNAYSQVQQVGLSALNGLSSQLTTFLTTGKASFKDFTRSILTMLTEILMKMALVKGIEAVGSAFGFGVTANAKGGVYSSASLSSYSGQIVDSPTLFAFAKGAGLMGEAGPEAIMPLTRNSNGVLGVRAVGAVGSTAPVVNINIATDGRVSQSSSAGLEQFGGEIGKFVDQRFKTLLHKEMGQGRSLSTAMKGRRG